MSEETTFGVWLLEQRKNRGLLQREVAAEVGVNKSTIGKWERGQALPLHGIHWDRLDNVFPGAYDFRPQSEVEREEVAMEKVGALIAGTVKALEEEMERAKSQTIVEFIWDVSVEKLKDSNILELAERLADSFGDEFSGGTIEVLDALATAGLLLVEDDWTVASAAYLREVRGEAGRPNELLP